MSQRSIAVVGAGAAGLVTAREAMDAGHDVTLFEQSDRVGGLWIYRESAESDPLGQHPEERVHGSLYASLHTNLPRDLMPEQADRAEEHRSRDEFLEDAIETKLNPFDMTIGQIKFDLGDAFRDHSAHRIGNALRNAGWVKKKREVDGKRRWVWSPPPE